MCGICGFNWEDPALIKKMLGIMQHRGPDDSRVYEDKGLTLGYNRLSIIDLKSGNQPLFNEKKDIILFFNGEIYNFRELREKLEGKKHRFYTNADGEVIIHSYEEYGKDCVKTFRGMFAFALYDSSKKELFIARDHLGIKPLYYSFHSGKFIFASEIKAILENSEIKREIDDSSLRNYFTFRYCPGKRTAFKDILKLEPGYHLVFKDGKIKISKYWDLSFGQENLGIDTYREGFLRVFGESVKNNLESDVPIGVLLSGGIDSSSIVAMMSRTDTKPINTYTLGFDQGFDNEFKHAKLVSDTFGTNHNEIIIDSGSIKDLADIVWHLDEPVADPTAIPNYILAGKASRKVKVLINGDGADELFGGYEQYKVMGLLQNFRKTPDIIRMPFEKLAQKLPDEPFFNKLNEFISAKNSEDAYTSLISVFGEREKESILSIRKTKNANPLHQFFLKPKHLINKMLYTDIKSYLPDNMLLKYDKITMAKSIEGRVPYCDPKVAEFSASLPPEYLIHNGTEKFIIREAMKGILPKKIINRKKQKFLVPTDNWQNREFGEFSRALIDENKQTAKSFFREKELSRILENKNFSSAKLLSMNSLTRLYYSRQLWTVTNFILWYDIFMNNEKKYFKHGF